MAESVPDAAPVEEPAKVACTAERPNAGRSTRRRFPSRLPPRSQFYHLPGSRQRKLLPSRPRRPTMCGSCAMTQGPWPVPVSPRTRRLRANFEFAVCRRRKPTVVSAQPSELSSEGSELARQDLPSTMIPEPSVAVEPSPAIAETAPHPARIVVPEPQQSSAQSSPSADAQPSLTQPSTIMTADSAKPVDGAKLAEKADVGCAAAHLSLPLPNRRWGPSGQ